MVGPPGWRLDDFGLFPCHSCDFFPAQRLPNRDPEFIFGGFGMFVSRSTVGLTVLAALIALAGSACGSSSPSAPTVAADVTISMVGDRASQSYSPNPATMRVGQTVSWKNNDSTA